MNRNFVLLLCLLVLCDFGHSWWRKDSKTVVEGEIGEEQLNVLGQLNVLKDAQKEARVQNEDEDEKCDQEIDDTFPEWQRIGEDE